MGGGKGGGRSGVEPGPMFCATQGPRSGPARRLDDEAMTEETITMKLGEPNRKFEECFATFGSGGTYEAYKILRSNGLIPGPTCHCSVSYISIHAATGRFSSQRRRGRRVSQALVDSRGGRSKD